MPPPARRRMSPDEELQARIDALEGLNAPRDLGEPRMDARAALLALADERDAEAAAAEAEGFAKDPEMARSPSRLAKEVEPTIEQLYARQKELKLPDVPLQKPVPDAAKPPPYVEYQRDDNEPPPRAVPAAQNLTVNTAPQQEMGPPAPEDVIASARDPFDPRDPIPPVYTPPPEEDQSAAQEAGPIPEEVAALPRTSQTSSEAEHARAAMRALQPRATPGQAPPPEGAAPAPAAAALAPGQAPPPAGGPDYSSVAGRVASTPQQGASPDPFGHDDDGGFKRAEQIRRARELYAQGKDDGAHRWEDEFLSKHRRIEDDEIRRRSMIIGIIGGYDRARTQANDWRASQQDFDKGLAEARERDRLEARVPLETAEAFAASGQVSPEAAAQMRNNSGLLKQFGQFASQGGRAEHLDYQRDKMMHEMHTKIALLEAGNESKERIADKNAETQKAVASTYANGRKRAEEAKRLTPEEHANLVGVTLSKKYGFSLPIGKEAARGNYANVPPELREEVEGDVIMSIGQSDIASARKLGTDVLAIPAKADEQAKAAAKKAAAVNAESLKLYIAKQKADPKFRLEYVTSWHDKSAAVGQAWAAWKQMSDAGQKAFVQWAGNGFAGQVGDALIGTKDGLLIGPIQTLVNELVKERSGATVTDQEWGRLGREVGLANGSYSPFKGTGALEGFMKRAGQRLTRHRQIFEETMGGWEKGP
jgi:hypothetical protein